MSDFDNWWHEQEDEYGHIRSPANRFSKKAWVFREKEIEKLQEQNKKMREALESIAFLDEPRADTYEFWAHEADRGRFAETLANDTDIARQALETIKTEKESEK